MHLDAVHDKAALSISIVPKRLLPRFLFGHRRTKHWRRLFSVTALPLLFESVHTTDTIYRSPPNPRQVVQLAGYVSEHSAYHHGEASLNGTITAMAQNYTGSNNLNLLTPGGQFGTRLMGGKARPRISTVGTILTVGSVVVVVGGTCEGPVDLAWAWIVEVCLETRFAA